MYSSLPLLNIRSTTRDNLDFKNKANKKPDVMSADSEQQEPNQQTDFDSLFILNEEDKADLVAKQQQISYIRRGEGGSGAGSPARGSPARRTQVRHNVLR